MPAAESTVLIDNERTRVTEWRFAPDADTGWHTHEFDYVVLPLLDGVLKIEEDGGETSMVTLSAGSPYFRPAGVRHNVRNANAFEFVFVDIDIKPAG